LIRLTVKDEHVFDGLDSNIRELVNRLIELGFIEKKGTIFSSSAWVPTYGLTLGAKELLVRIRVEYDLSSAEDYILRTWNNLISLNAPN